MANIDVVKVTTRGLQAVSYILGTALLTFNLTAFKLSKGGSIYYLDKNQTWLAAGAALIALGVCIKNWQRL
ncbi:MAG: hypothetical protein OEV42_16815 [Deltaproteobacteria bacterium]|nr:hypothetical protein [Deltaproteobacteria bacterium]